MSAEGRFHTAPLCRAAPPTAGAAVDSGHVSFPSLYFSDFMLYDLIQVLHVASSSVVSQSMRYITSPQ